MIRPAQPEDLAAVQNIVAAAYAPLAARMDETPAPMQDDYAARIAEGAVSVFEHEGAVIGLLVISDLPDAMMLENVAIAPEAQGQGAGRQLIAYAEVEAIRRGFTRVRLYTHITMIENQWLYRRLGYDEVSRGEDDGFERVQYAKTLAS